VRQLLTDDALASEGSRLLTENQINQSWRRLFRGGELSDQTLQKAEALLEELRPESPLRHRLQAELDELRQRVCQRQG